MSVYDLPAALQLIQGHNFRRVVLQFPDEEVHRSTEVYEYFQDQLGEEVEIFITADSTWGSSIDDVSAMHCEGDVLLYFGSDLSSSGSMPVMVVPRNCEFDIEVCRAKLEEALQAHDAKSTSYKKTHGSCEGEGPRTKSCFIFYEAGCFKSASEIKSRISYKSGMAELPACADLANWTPSVRSSQESSTTLTEQINPTTTTTTTAAAAGGLSQPNSSFQYIGGLKVSQADILQLEGPTDQLVIVYIGDKVEQLVNILLRLSQHTVLHYSPAEQSVRTVQGCLSREFKERYGGVVRVRDASIIGIIVGSMGLTGDLTRDVLHRLQTLILAAGKRFYTFVMGRLNEAKLL